jgi:hypothetical protein
MKGTLILTMGLVAVVTLVGCGASNPAGPGATKVVGSSGPDEGFVERNALIGTWQMQGGSGTPPLIAFKDGGGVEVTEAAGYEGAVTVSGTYVAVGDKLILTASNEGSKDAGLTPQALERFTTYSYTIDGNTLTLTDAYGASRWVKM